MDALQGLDIFVVDCFQRQPHHTHARLATVLDWARQLRPARTVLTHMGTDMDWAWLRQTLPAGVEPGYDGMILEL